MNLDTIGRIEPTLLDDIPVALSDVTAEVAAAAGALGAVLHPRTAAQLADLVRIMNTYYSNLIEGHHTRPRDIARASGARRDQSHPSHITSGLPSQHGETTTRPSRAGPRPSASWTR